MFPISVKPFAHLGVRLNIATELIEAISNYCNEARRINVHNATVHYDWLLESGQSNSSRKIR